MVDIFFLRGIVYFNRSIMFLLLWPTCELCGRHSDRKGKATGVRSSCISNGIWTQRKLVEMTTNDKTGSNSNSFTFVHWDHSKQKLKPFSLLLHPFAHKFIFPFHFFSTLFFYVCLCNEQNGKKPLFDAHSMCVAYSCLCVPLEEDIGSVEQFWESTHMFFSNLIPSNAEVTFFSSTI